MEGNPELLDALQDELTRFNDQFMEVAVEVLRNDVSRYPIFVAHKMEVPLGRKFLDRELYNSAWSYSISHLEDFVHKDFIVESKVDMFRKAYKNPTTHMCLFVIAPEGSGIVFYPYK